LLLDPKLVIPKHIAIIMDGNGRWAKARGKMRTFGHKKGVEVARNIVRVCAELGVKSLTLFAFSSENWQRPEKEVGFIMGLFMDALQSQVKELHKNEVRLRFIGNRSALKDSLNSKMLKAEELMQDNTGLQLNVAVSYGGRWDIVNATKQALMKKAKTLDIATPSENLDVVIENLMQDVDEDTIESFLQTTTQAPVDLMIRSGGEQRISNFLLWQAAYAEFIFTDTLWPNFTREHLLDAISEFSARQRRFGKTGEQIEIRSQQHEGNN